MKRKGKKKEQEVETQSAEKSFGVFSSLVSVVQPFHRVTTVFFPSTVVQNSLRIGT